MSDRRSSRGKKLVDYSKFAAGQDQDDDFEDDDFESFTPPVSKKTKKESKQKKENKQKAVKPKSICSVDVHSVPSRNSLNRKTADERTFEKELELALELSRTNCQVDDQVQEKLSVNDHDTPENSVVIDEQECVETEATIEQPCMPVLQPQNQTVDVEDKYEDVKALPPTLFSDSSEIEVLEENVRENARKTAKKRAYVESDSNSDSEDDEFKLEDVESEDSESEFDADGGDSDFEPSEKKTSKSPAKQKPSSITKKTSAITKNSNGIVKKPVPVINNLAALNPSKKIALSQVSPAASKKATTMSGLSAKKSTPLQSRSPLSGLQAKSPASLLKSTGLISKSPACLPKTTGLMNRSPAPSLVGGKFNSPGLVSQLKSPASGLGGVQLKSPASGGLRLGLSRNIRLKPLHSNVKVTPS